jgi:hypothetical protein
VYELASCLPPTASGEHTFEFEQIDLTMSVAAHMATSSAEATSGPLGHDNAMNHRGLGDAVVTTLVLALVTGARQP